MRVLEQFIGKSMEEGREIQRMAVTANFGNLSEYEKSQLSWAHGITSVTGLRLCCRALLKKDHVTLTLEASAASLSH